MLREIYETEKLRGQSLEQFEKEVAADPDKPITLLYQKQGKQHGVASSVYNSIDKMRNAMSDTRRCLNEEKDNIQKYAPSLAEYMSDFGQQLDIRIALIEKSLADLKCVPLKPDYAGYIKHLESMKLKARTDLPDVQDVPDGPRVIELPLIGDFSFPDQKYPVRLNNFIVNISAEYKDYYDLVAEYGAAETDLIMSPDTFQERITKISNDLREFDILRCRDELLYVSKKGKDLYLTPTTGQQGHWLPDEALEMFKRYKVQHIDDLENLYGCQYNIHGIHIIGTGKDDHITLSRLGCEGVEITLNGYSLMMDKKSFDSLPDVVKKRIQKPVVKKSPEKPVVKAVVKKSPPPLQKTPVNYNTMTVAMLKDLLRQRKLHVSGIKAVLIKRLEDDDSRMSMEAGN